MSDSRVKQIDSNRNGRSRGSSPNPSINNIAKPPSVIPADDLTPDTSDDDSRE